MNSASQEMGWMLGKTNLVNVRQDTDLQHIDFIWYREPLVPTGVYKILDSGGSDHLPVLANFDMQ